MIVDDQLRDFNLGREGDRLPLATSTPLGNGGFLILVPSVDIGPGWNRPAANVIFVLPPGYPSAQPDCFWVEPEGFRLANGGTPQSSNDSNPIPGDVNPARRTTWFSWHLQSWNPNRDSLATYFGVVMKRLKPAR